MGYETAHWALRVPNDPRLKGLELAIQGLSAPIFATPTFTNTAVFEIF